MRFFHGAFGIFVLLELGSFAVFVVACMIDARRTIKQKRQRPRGTTAPANDWEPDNSQDHIWHQQQQLLFQEQHLRDHRQFQEQQFQQENEHFAWQSVHSVNEGGFLDNSCFEPPSFGF